MDLGRDAFTIIYDPVQVDVAAIMARIRGLGYKPEKATGGNTKPRITVSDDDPVPEPISSVMARAQTADRFTLIDFYAAWCGPCKVLEDKVLGDPRVRAALEEFEFVKVDTDEHVEPSDYFQVVGLPTLVVLDPGGREIYRLEGMIEADELARKLNELAESKKE